MPGKPRSPWATRCRCSPRSRSRTGRQCGHFASVHHGGGGGRPGGSSCATPGCGCRKFVEANEARAPLGTGNLTAVEVAHLTGLSVHKLNYWRQSGQGPKPIKAGSRTLYRRQDVEQWLADVDGRAEPSPAGAADWFKKAVETADRIEAAGLNDDDQGHMLGGRKPIVRFVAGAAGRRGFTSANNSADTADDS